MQHPLLLLMCHTLCYCSCATPSATVCVPHPLLLFMCHTLCYCSCAIPSATVRVPHPLLLFVCHTLCYCSCIISRQTVSERYYKTLYVKLLDQQICTMSKQGIFLNVLYKSVSSDPQLARTKVSLEEWDVGRMQSLLVNT